MITLIINAANEKILLSLISDSESYTTTHANSRENFDKIMDLILNFLEKHNCNFNKINQIFVNQGPGKVSSIRNSISIAKGVAFAKNIDLYGYFSEDLVNKSEEQLVKIDKSNFTNINLIKPLYSS